MLVSVIYRNSNVYYVTFTLAMPFFNTLTLVIQTKMHLANACILLFVILTGIQVIRVIRTQTRALRILIWSEYIRVLHKDVLFWWIVCGVLGGCDINSLRNCAHQLANYERQISAGIISYTESELEDICRLVPMTPHPLWRSVSICLLL